MKDSNVLDAMRAIDAAWNARRWQEYASLLSDDLVAWSGTQSSSHGKAAHVLNARAFCSRHPDARVIIDPYLRLFASGDGTQTCSVASLGGIEGQVITFACICSWRGGQIVEQLEFVPGLSI